MELTLINDLFESRMFPSRSSAKRYTVEDIANMTFLSFLAIEVLKSEFDTSHFASDYLYQTFKFGNFDKLQNGSTDLYWMMHILMGKDLELLNHHEGNELELNKISFDDLAMKTWARLSIKGTSTDSIDRRFLLSLERMLNIRVSDYKSTRLLISSWTKINDEQRKLSITRLLFAMRKRMPRSELLPHVEALAKHKKLEVIGATNPEEENHSDTKSDLIKKLAIGAAMGAAVALPIMGGIKRYKEFKHEIDSMHPRSKYKESINEDGCAGGAVSGGAASVVAGGGLGSATSSGNIATFVSPLGGVVSRVKRSNRKKKK